MFYSYKKFNKITQKDEIKADILPVRCFDRLMLVMFEHFGIFC